MAGVAIRHAAVALTAALLCACAPLAPDPNAVVIDPIAKEYLPDHRLRTGLGVGANIDLRVRSNASAPYKTVNSFDVPASHTIGDGLFPYEGIGWENGLVGYRLYLDGRLVSDIFGKQTPAPALAGIGQHGSYHALAPWGMDVLKVGPSLGIGGLGVMRAGEPRQFGTISTLSATVDKDGGDQGAFTITANGIDAGPGVSGAVTARYMIARGSPMTRVRVNASGNLPLVSGIVMHDGAEFWQSDVTTGAWQYLASWGQQSENKDGLGLALFYRTDQASYRGLGNATHFVTFSNSEFEYGFVAAWERDPMKVNSRAAFDELLMKELLVLQGTEE